MTASRELSRKLGSRPRTENAEIVILRNNTKRQFAGSPHNPNATSMIPDLSSRIYYLGGVPPGFKSGATKAPGADNAFLGCMKEITIEGIQSDPFQETSYGVELGCKNSITMAGFYGQGQIELPSQSLLERSNFAFIFRTLQSEALLLLSAYPPESSTDYDSKDIRGNYSISLIDGHIHFWIDNGKGRIKLVSNSTYDDGEFHVIHVIKMKKKITLLIDDKLEASKKLNTIQNVSLPMEGGGLYIGGIPDNTKFTDLAPTFIKFEGSVKDIVFNDKIITFDKQIDFSNVIMGRPGPEIGSNRMSNLPMKTQPIGERFKPPAQGCQSVSIFFSNL